MTTTGPLPALGHQVSVSTQRTAALTRMSPAIQGGIWRAFHTADAVIDVDNGILYIVADIDPDPEDWAAICGLIAAVGFGNGSQDNPRDPGEPGFDPLSGVCTWRLEFTDSCPWCDGRGESYGCPLCERVSLR